MSSSYYNINKEFKADTFIVIDGSKLKDQACKEIENNFNLTKEEAENYYEMIKDDDSNTLIGDIRNKLSVKVEPVGFTLSYKMIKRKNDYSIIE